MAFEIGQEVVLKSGSPKMVVSEVTAKGLVKVQWFQNGDLKDANFNDAMLVLSSSVPSVTTPEPAKPETTDKPKGAFSYPSEVKIPQENGPNIQVSANTIREHTMNWDDAIKANKMTRY